MLYGLTGRGMRVGPDNALDCRFDASYFNSVAHFVFNKVPSISNALPFVGHGPSRSGTRVVDPLLFLGFVEGSI